MWRFESSPGSKKVNINSLNTKNTLARVKASELDLKDRLVHVGRTAKVVKGGKRFGFSAIVVVGDGNGHVGIGLGKAREVSSAIAKGTEEARKNVVKVTVLKGTEIGRAHV